MESSGEFSEWENIVFFLILFGTPLLLGWLIWGVFTPPKTRPAAYVEPSQWIWMTLALLFLVVLGVYIL
jgi:hypothetical protein